MHRGDEEHGDEILLLRPHADLPPPPAPLRPVEADRVPLDVPRVGDGDHHLLVHDQVLEPQVLRLALDLGAAGVGVGVPDLAELLPDHAQELRLLTENLFEPGDLLSHLLQFLQDLLALQPGQPLQPHVEDRLRLDLRQAELRHEAFPRLLRVLRGPDQLDDGIEVVEGDRQPEQDVLPAFRLPQEEQGPPCYDLLPEGEELLEELLEGHRPRPVLDDRQQLHAEGGLHLRLLVQVVEDDLGDRVLLQLHDHAHPVAVGFVAQVRDLLDLLVPHQLRHPLDEAGLVHLVRDLGDDDRLPVPLLRLLDEGPRADLDGAAPRAVRVAHPVEPVQDPAGGEVGRRDVLHQLVDRDLGVADQGKQGADHLAEVVRRDGGRHPDGDPRAPVHQQVGDTGRKDARLLERTVVVGERFDGLLVEVGEKLPRHLGHPDLGVPHRRGRVAVHRSEVPLPVDQRVPQRELLHHAHEGVVHRVVAVRMIFTDHVADDAGGLLVRLAVLVSQLVHGEEDAALDGFQAVADVGERPPDDHAHRVVEVALAHLVLNGAGLCLLLEQIHGDSGAPSKDPVILPHRRSPVFR